MMREAWTEVDLSALRHNAAVIAKLVGPQAQVAAVVKAGAYGHGLLPVALAVEAVAGVWGCAVACGEEAVALREGGVRKPILVLGPPPRQGAADLARQDITLAVADRGDIAALTGQLSGTDLAADVHLKVNTGMCRMGVEPAEVAEMLAAMEGTALRCRGAFSHFATAEAQDLSFARHQLAAFRQALAAAPAAQFIRHIANSAALARLPETRFDLVRPGAMLYGLNTGVPEAAWPPVKPALRLVARVAALKRFAEGCSVGYGCRFRTTRPSAIALVPVGYADGYPRPLSGQAEVLIRGQRAPVVGSVNMDSITVDVTDISGVEIGDEVVLIGAQGGERITVEELAARAGTIVHEIPTRLGPRLPRVYV